MTRYVLAWLGCVLSVIGVALAQVGPSVATDRAETRLVSATMSAAPGETVTLALVQQLAEGWHVYWQNPGDSGLPLRLDWSLPVGYETDAPIYPLPHRLPLGPLMNYGHEGAPIFLVPMTVPETAQPGTTVALSVRADWLICLDICVPEGADLTLLLPITDAAGAPTIGYADRIAAARAEQPIQAPFDVAYHDGADGPVLRLTGAPDTSFEFYPFAPSLIEPSVRGVARSVGDEQWLSFTAGFAYQAAKPDAISGLLVAQIDGQRIGYEFRAPKTSAPANADPSQPAGLDGARNTPPSRAATGILMTLVAALVGGLLLNIMPCVFPIVFLKAAGFASIPREERNIIRRHGLVYTVGVLTAFAALGTLLILLRAGGDQIGWGFHLQSPAAVGTFALIIFAIGLNLAGVFELGTSAQGVGDTLARRSGDAGAFFTGLLAVAVAAPCIGPFLGAAIGLAVVQPPAIGLMIFLAIGLGLALPYLLISFFPVLSSLLPRPGPWMETLKQLFSFAMFATVVWLVWVLVQQAGAPGMLKIGVSMVLVGLAAWLFGRSQSSGAGKVSRVLAVLVLAAAIVPVMNLKAQPAGAGGAMTANRLEPVAYSAEALADLRSAGQPVFVDFTAAWCVSCQFNKVTVLDTPEVASAFAEHGVTYMVADWTLQDPEITAALEAYGRAGVPLYLYFSSASEEAAILPAVLNKRMVVSLITE